MTDPVKDGIEVAWYTARINGWMTARLELDKTLLTLSGGGIGVAVTLLTTVGANSTRILWLYALAVSAFVVSVASVMTVLHGNAKLLETPSSPDQNTKLKALDIVSCGAFILGVVIMLAIGAMTAKAKLDQQETTMSQKQTGQSKDQIGDRKLPDQQQSWQGINTFKPKPEPPTQQAAEPPKEPPKQDTGGQQQK